MPKIFLTSILLVCVGFLGCFQGHEIVPLSHHLEILHFEIPSYSETAIVPVSSLEVESSFNVVGYLIQPSPVQPNENDLGWLADKPTELFLPSTGVTTIFAWVKDEYHQVSDLTDASYATIEYSLPVDSKPPIINDFQIPDMVNTSRLPIESFLGNDNMGITGWMLSFNLDTPAVGDPNWLSEVPTEMILPCEGYFTVYPWLKDEAGNISVVSSDRIRTVRFIQADQYESDDSGNEAKTIEVHEIQRRSLHRAGDVDWIQFYAQDSQTYTLETFPQGGGLTLDTRIDLFSDINGEISLGSNDDKTIYSRLIWTCPSTGYYWVQVSSFGNTGVGHYLLTLEDSLSHYALTLNVSDFGSVIMDGVTYSPEGSPYVLDRALGESVTLEVVPDVGFVFAGWRGAHADTIEGFYPYYTIEVDANKSIAAYFEFEQNGGDAYEPDNTPSFAATLLTNGMVQQRSIHYDQDIDWIRFTAETNHTYRIETISFGTDWDLSLSSQPQPTDTELQIFAPDQWVTSIASNDERIPHPQLQWTCPAAGVYYLLVKGLAGKSVGDYQIKVTAGGIDPVGLTLGVSAGGSITMDTLTLRPMDLKRQFFFPSGTLVTVTLATDEPFTFAGWDSAAGGAGDTPATLQGTYPTYTILLDSDVDLTATFTPRTASGQWLFIMYMDADNNLEGNLWDDINEMEKGLYDMDANVRDQCTMLVLWDGSPGYSDASPTGTVLFQLGPDSEVNQTLGSSTKNLLEMGNFKSLEWLSSGELDMGSPMVLAQVLIWAQSQFPGYTYQGLFFSNHGGGARSVASVPSRAICWDETSNSLPLYTKDLHNSLVAAGYSAQKPLSILGMDACLMATVEEAFENREVAQYFVASMELEQMSGWEYHHWLPLLTKGFTPKDLSILLVTSYHERFGSMKDQTLVAVDLSQMDALKTVLDTLSTAIISEQRQADTKALFGSSISFDGSYAIQRDLGDFVAQVKTIPELSESAEAVLEILAKAIVQTWAGAYVGDYYGTGLQTPRGVSIVGDANNSVPEWYTGTNFQFAQPSPFGALGWVDLLKEWYP